jgi:mono/diheme cytochrome c family protein
MMRGFFTFVRKLIVFLLFAGVVGFGVFWFLTIPDRVAPLVVGQHTVDLANGKTMFHVGGCSSCHATPKQDDKTKLGGGLALGSPFGTFYAPNISPHPTDGIGNWTEAQFVTAAIKGTSPDGEHYYPAFPYTSYQRATFGDLRDLFAYIKTLPQVAGRVRDHDLPFPFNIRRGLGLWKLLCLDSASFVPDRTRSAAWNRGAYLVNSFGHCAECHSPRDFLGGIIDSQRFAGGPSPDGKGWVPNITQKALGKWSEKDIAYMLETGDLPDGDSVGGEMVPVVRNLAQIPADDRAAMAAYLKSLRPVTGPTPPSKSKQ